MKEMKIFNMSYLHMYVFLLLSVIRQPNTCTAVRSTNRARDLGCAKSRVRPGSARPFTFTVHKGLVFWRYLIELSGLKFCLGQL